MIVPDVPSRGAFFMAHPHLPPLDTGGSSLSLSLSSSTPSAASCSSPDLFSLSSSSFASIVLHRVLLVFGWSALDPWRLRESGRVWAVPEQVLGLDLGGIRHNHRGTVWYVDGEWGKDWWCGSVQTCLFACWTCWNTQNHKRYYFIINTVSFFFFFYKFSIVRMDFLSRIRSCKFHVMIQRVTSVFSIFYDVLLQF